MIYKLIDKIDVNSSKLLKKKVIIKNFYKIKKIRLKLLL